MKNNPFTYGNPITNPARFVGRESELNQIITRLRNAAFESSSVVGERRIGKSSLLNALETRGPTLGGQGSAVCVLSLDPQMLSSQATPRRFWDRVLRQLSRTLPEGQLKVAVEELRQAESLDTFDLSDLFDQLDDAGLSVALLLDEFERVAGNSNFGPDFFYGLRALAIHHRLALITASYAELSTLSHSDDVRASPFFNIFATVHLGSFDPEEADELFERYLTDTDVRFQKSERAFLASIAGAHPYYLQIGGGFLFDAHQQGLPAKERLTYTRERFTIEAEDTMEHSWRQSSDEEKISLTVLALLSAPQDRTAGGGFSKGKLTDYYGHAGPTLARLARRGVVAERNGGYALFSAVLAEWIRKELRAAIATPQTYEAWLNDPANQGRLAQVKASLAGEVKERVLPKLKESYWELVVGWLTNPATVTAAFELLRSQLG
ncbi:MAG: AAA-like domain-containing protein [Chloroflexota bacterium]|nr:AAA-like domain-containing protein [Chloroflexota bacterium]